MVRARSTTGGVKRARAAPVQLSRPLLRFLSRCRLLRGSLLPRGDFGRRFGDRGVLRRFVVQKLLQRLVAAGGVDVSSLRDLLAVNVVFWISWCSRPVAVIVSDDPV